MENLTANLENSQRLQEVAKKKGVELPESYFRWTEGNVGEQDYYVTPERLDKFVFEVNAIPAYTAGEFGEVLSKNGYGILPDYSNQQNNEGWYKDMISVIILAPTEADARCLMLIHLLEEGLIDRV